MYYRDTEHPPRLQIEAYDGQSVHSLGSCVLHLHIDNKAFPTVFEVTNMTGSIILGRTQAKAMGYGICTRLCVHMSESTKATQAKQSKQTEEPVVPKIKWNTDSIELNGKMHNLPITKDYILKEYNDVFKGVGTLPGGPYHIRLKEQ